MLKKSIAIALSVMLMGCVSLASAAEPEACVANFKTAGSFMTGKQYTTFQEFSAVAQATAYKAVYQKVLSEGWKVNASDKEMGTLSVSEDVSFGNGKTAPMIILVVSSGATGSKVTLTFATSGMMSVKANTLRDKFCVYLAAVSQAPAK